MSSVFLQATDERNLYYCIYHGLWGSKNRKLDKWQAGDFLIAYVDRALAALFEVTGNMFFDETPVWPNEIYPYRVPIKLKKLIHPKDRYSTKNEDIREVMFKYHTKSYGMTVVLAANPLHENAARILYEHVIASTEWHDFDLHKELEQLENLISEEQEAIEEEIIEARPVIQESQPAESLHTEIQWYLAHLGTSLGYEVWIPKPDQGKTYRGEELRVLSLEEMPALPFNKDVNKIISYIDVIWFQEDNPTHIFEVEHTTSIYSGILRMSDLVTMIPALNIRMYICASEDRKKKVQAEITRPTFEKRTTPLSKRCRFIPFEGLSEFMDENNKVMNHLKNTILDDLSESLENI